MTERSRVAALQRAAVVVFALTTYELGLRSLSPVPFAPDLAGVAVCFAIYALCVVPAIALLFLGRRLRRLHELALAATFAVLGGNLAFAFGNRSIWILSLAALAGVCLGALLLRLRTALVVGLGAAAVAAFTWTVGLTPARRADTAEPSVLLVVLDTTSAKRLSTYGHDRPTSPNLTALAGRGIRYERALANAPWTLPSHASMFAGMLPSELGFDGGRFADLTEIGSIAGDLADSGRITHAISANPMIAGFDELRAGFDSVWGVRDLVRPLPLIAFDRFRDRGMFQVAGAQVTDLAIDWLDRISPPEGPWFLFLNYLDPHAPYRPPHPEAQRFAPSIDPESVDEDTQHYNSGLSPLTDDVRRAIGELYDGEVAALDAALGRLLGALEQRGYDESNLLVVVTADHGEALGEQGFIGHMLGMPDSVLHVPLVVAGPGIEPGVVREPVQLNQLRATLRELLHLPTRDGIASPLPPWGPPPSMLITEHPEPRWYARELTQFNPAGGKRSLGNWVAVERQGVKSVFDDQGNGSTYVLATDPDELAPQPLARGQTLVEAYAERTTGHRLVSRGAIAEKAHWALRQLGYTHE